ncbi:hypothetical protein [Haloechinothrix alba]|uniref:hypothetical protein n=1 Tax=Haloechinothrix alba TaxID=664784 RepID=UPI000B79441A|nr:hypothetical protein [Haloechinothrix alba]
MDLPTAVRGASIGFSVLVVGGLLTPIAVRTWDVLGLVWLPGVAVLAFAWAAGKACAGRDSIVQGMLAASGAYMFVLPLVALGTGGLDASQVSLTAIVAVIIGGGSVPMRRYARARRSSWSCR